LPYIKFSLFEKIHIGSRSATGNANLLTGNDICMFIADSTIYFTSSLAENPFWATYICSMKLEDAIKSSRFVSEKQKAAINVLYTGYWLRSGYSTNLKKEDLTMEQFNVLRILKGKHPEQMCVKDIAGRTIEKSSNVPRILDRLVLKKLASRTPSKEDKRETLVSLTEKGISVLERANVLAWEVTNRIKALNEEEARTLNELLEKMRASVPEGEE